MLHAFDEPVPIFLTIMTVILITPVISQRIRLPGIVGLILGGLLVSPHVLGLLDLTPTIELLGTVGLVYLMFNAGLEINLHQFSRVRKKAAVFGILTFIIPLVVTIIIGLTFRLNWLSAILLGATFASHTLIAYPIISRYGLARNEAISVVVGATVFTDVMALLVLAVISNIKISGQVTLFEIAKLILFIGGYAVAVLQGLPRLGKFFFQRFSGRDIEFQFVLVALFGASVGAEIIGMHAIVGAFLAGLAINATIPNHSPVKSQTIFLGNSFFIPMFMIFVGMNIDPSAFLDNRRTLIFGIILTLAVYLTKFIAAWITTRIYKYSRDELLVFWGLSQAQAAATIATILIGVELELFDLTIFNAAILAVLCTSITSPILVERFGKHVEVSQGSMEMQGIFNRILVPLANPDTEKHLLTLASILCSNDGTLLPLSVAQERNGKVNGLEKQKIHLEKLSEIIENPEINIEPVYRIGHSIGRTIVRAGKETDASLIVMGWHGEPSIEGRIFGTVLDHVVWNSDLPVVVALIRAPINSMKRLCFTLPNHSLHPSLVNDTLRIVLIMAQTLNVPLYILTSPNNKTRISEFIENSDIEIPYSINIITKSLIDQMKSITLESDLVVIPTAGSRTQFSSSLGRDPERLANTIDSSIIVIHK